MSSVVRLALESADAKQHSAWQPAPQENLGRVCDVYDGDTLTLLCSISDTIYKFHTRIMGVDCPEMRGRGEKEKEAAKAVRDIVITLCRNKICDLETHGTDKYGRLIADLWLPSGIRLSHYLLSWGLARPYSGGTRTPFTDTELSHIIDTCHVLESGASGAFGAPSHHRHPP